jgi:hypothetical protein
VDAGDEADFWRCSEELGEARHRGIERQLWRQFQCLAGKEQAVGRKLADMGVRG